MVLKLVHFFWDTVLWWDRRCRETVRWYVQLRWGEPGGQWTGWGWWNEERSWFFG